MCSLPGHSLTLTRSTWLTRQATTSREPLLPSTSGQLLQTVDVAVESIGIATILILIVELPDSIVGPAAGRGAGRGAVAGEDEGVGVGEGLGVAGAFRPPRRVRVQQRVPPRAGVVRVAEVLDPRHRLLRRHHAFALQVQHPRKRDPVPAPVPAVLQEVLGLRGLGSAGLPNESTGINGEVK